MLKGQKTQYVAPYYEDCPLRYILDSGFIMKDSATYLKKSIGGFS